MTYPGDRAGSVPPRHGLRGSVSGGSPEWAPRWGVSGVTDALYLRQALQGETLERSGAFSSQHPKLATANAIPRFWGRLIKALRGPGPWRFEWHDEVPQGAMQGRDHGTFSERKLDAARFSRQRDPAASPRLKHQSKAYVDRAGVGYSWPADVWPATRHVASEDMGVAHPGRHGCSPLGAVTRWEKFSFTPVRQTTPYFRGRPLGRFALESTPAANLGWLDTRSVGRLPAREVLAKAGPKRFSFWGSARHGALTEGPWAHTGDINRRAKLYEKWRWGADRVEGPRVLRGRPLEDVDKGGRTQDLPRHVRPVRSGAIRAYQRYATYGE